MAYISFQPKDYFTTHLYSGNDTTNNQQVGLTPDWVWVKCRNNGVPSHYVVDKLRGDEKYISSNATTAEQTDSNTFDLVSGGFNLAGGNGWTNVTGRNYASWNWRASNATAVSNTDGSITSTVSASTTSGFSIVSYTGNGSDGATVGHGLGVSPNVVFVKRTSGGTGGWRVYHSSIHASSGETNTLTLNDTDANASDIDNISGVSATTFTTRGTDATNASGSNFIAYCFAQKSGFSSMGSYVGNGSTDGSFIYTGMSPAFVMTKRTDTTSAWDMFDNKREGYNPDNDALFANLTNAEDATDRMDLVSNGFKMRISGGSPNYSGGSYIYLAFAESPIVSSNGVPATAR